MSRKIIGVTVGTPISQTRIEEVLKPVKTINGVSPDDAGNVALEVGKGDKGDPFTYDDFTPEQLSALKGDKGDKGETGAQGIQGIQGIQGEKGDKGDKGDTGAKGDKGDTGNPFTYGDFTPEQLAALKGEKGDKGDQGDKGETGATGAKGETGETGAKGEKGDAGVYVGSDTPPDTANVWLDEAGESSGTETWTFTLEDGSTVQKTVVVLG